MREEPRRGVGAHSDESREDENMSTDEIHTPPLPPPPPATATREEWLAYMESLPDGAWSRDYDPELERERRARLARWMQRHEGDG